MAAGFSLLADILGCLQAGLGYRRSVTVLWLGGLGGARMGRSLFRGLVDKVLTVVLSAAMILAGTPTSSAALSADGADDQAGSMQLEVADEGMAVPEGADRLPEDGSAQDFEGAIRIGGGGGFPRS